MDGVSSRTHSVFEIDMQRGARGSFVAVGHTDRAFTRFPLLAVREGGDPGVVAIFAPGGADGFSRFGRRQRGALPATRAHDDLTARGTAFAQRHLIRA